jgi:hypothetical protein
VGQKSTKRDHGESDGEESNGSDKEDEVGVIRKRRRQNGLPNEDDYHIECEPVKSLPPKPSPLSQHPLSRVKSNDSKLDISARSSASTKAATSTRSSKRQQEALLRRGPTNLACQDEDDSEEEEEERSFKRQKPKSSRREVKA